MRVVSLVNLSRLPGLECREMDTSRKEPRRRYADKNWLRGRFRRQLPNSVGESADSVEGLKKIYIEPVKQPRILRGRGVSGNANNNGNGVVGPAIAGNNPITERWRLVAHVSNRSTHLRVAAGARTKLTIEISASMNAMTLKTTSAAIEEPSRTSAASTAAIAGRQYTLGMPTATPAMQATHTDSPSTAF